MGDHLIDLVVVLAVAILIAIAARRLKLSYTVGLVIVGAGFSLSNLKFGVDLTHDFIFKAILPPLLFEAALNLHWKELRKDALPILVLSTFGTIVAAATVTAGMMLLLHWPLPSALLFGVLIAATDPVAVIAMFKDNNVQGRLRLLVESESLFNDGVAAVLFGVALAWAGHGANDAPLSIHMLGSLGFTVAGGIVIGALFGGAAIAVIGQTSEHLIEAALTTFAAYGSFLVAEHFHASGVLATVTAGLVMGNLGILREENRGLVSMKGREFVLGFWEFAAFLANSLIFPLIGVNVANAQFDAAQLLTLAVAILVVLLGRALTVYPFCLFFTFSRWAIPLKEQHVLWWGGLRGALALALALSLPSDLPWHDEILTITFGVVAFSIVVQGLTMPFLLKRASKQIDAI